MRMISRSTDSAWLGWGIIGASTAAARFFVPALRLLAEQRGPLPPINSQVLAVFSSNVRRAHDFAHSHQIPHAYDDIHALLARPDVHCVYIANQLQRHADAVAAALDAGKQILCEPPISTDPEQAAALVTRASLRARQLWVNHFWRYDPALKSIRQALQDGTAGELLHLTISNASALTPMAQTWRLQPGAGILWDRTTQDIDLLLFLLEQMPQAVWATSGQRILGPHAEVDEEVAAILSLPHGIVIQLHDAYFDAHVPSSVTLHGTYAAYHAEGWAQPDAPTALNRRQRRAVTSIDVDTSSPFCNILADFMQSILSGSVPAHARPDRRLDPRVTVVQIAATLHQACRRGHGLVVRTAQV